MENTPIQDSDHGTPLMQFGLGHTLFSRFSFVPFSQSHLEWYMILAQIITVESDYELRHFALL